MWIWRSSCATSTSRRRRDSAAPSIVAGYLYTFIALMIVGSLLVFTFVDYADAFKLSSEIRQLKALMHRVAAKGTELVTLTLSANASADTFINTPQTVGNKGYWLQLLNDSDKAWIEGGLGTTPFEGSDLRTYLPPKTSGTGYYISGHGTIRLECASSAGVAQMQLAGSSGGE